MSKKIEKNTREDLLKFCREKDLDLKDLFEKIPEERLGKLIDMMLLWNKQKEQQQTK